LAIAWLKTVPAPPPVAALAALAPPPWLLGINGTPLLPSPPLDVAVAEAEPFVFNAVAVELADPPPYPRKGKPKGPPAPPTEDADAAAVADAEPVKNEVVAVDAAAPPEAPLPPAPPVAVAQLDGALGEVALAVAFASPPGCPGAPFAPTLLTQAA
jgi:hypothetical protein